MRESVIALVLLCSCHRSAGPESATETWLRGSADERFAAVERQLRAMLMGTFFLLIVGPGPWSVDAAREEQRGAGDF